MTRSLRAVSVFADLIKPAVQESVATGGAAEVAASHLVRAALECFKATPSPLNFSSDEGREVLRSASSEIRLGALKVLNTGLSAIPPDGRGEAWRTQFEPAFNAVWPRAREFVTNEVSKQMFEIVLNTGEQMASGLELLRHYITPFSDESIDLSSLSDDEFAIVDRYPGETLALLWAACQPPCSGRSYQITDVLDRIGQHGAAYRNDRRLQKLRLRALH